MQIKFESEEAEQVDFTRLTRWLNASSSLIYRSRCRLVASLVLNQFLALTERSAASGDEKLQLVVRPNHKPLKSSRVTLMYGSACGKS